MGRVLGGSDQMRRISQLVGITVEIKDADDSDTSNSFNYLTLNILTLDLFINFFSKVLYFCYYSLLGNFGYPLLAY